MNKINELDNEIELLEKRLEISNKSGFIDELKKDGLFDLIDIPYFSQNDDIKINKNNKNDNDTKKENIKENITIENQEGIEYETNAYGFLNTKKIKELKTIKETTMNIESKIKILNENTQKHLIYKIGDRFLNDLNECNEFSVKNLFSLSYLYFVNFYSSKKIYIIEFIKKSLEYLSNLNDNKQIYYISYLYLLYFIDEDIFLEKLEKIINIKNYFQIISLVGMTIRKRNPKKILVLLEIVKKIENKDLYYDRLIQLVNKIKNNQTIESNHIDKYPFLIKTIKKIILKSKCKLFPILNSNIYSQINEGSDYIKIVEKNQYIKENTIGSKKLSNEEIKLIEKAKKYNFNSEKEPLIFSQIFKSSNYIEAANNIFDLKLHKNKKPIVIRLVIKLILKEKEINEFYPYFLTKLTEISPEYKFIIHYEIESFLTKIIKKLKKEDLIKISKFIVKLILLQQFNIKLVKNIFLSQFESKKKNYLKKLVITYLLSTISYNNIDKIFNTSKIRDFNDVLMDIFNILPANLKDKYQEKIDKILDILKVN